MKLHDVHVESLATSTALSQYYVANLITPLEVIGVLNGAGVRFVLVGTHGIGGWMQKPRTTTDVDVLVAARGHKKAVRALLSAFPQLEADDDEVVTRLQHRETKAVLIDVMKPNQPLFPEALQHTHAVTSDGQSYRILSLEMALAMKFAPLVSRTRAVVDKYLDAHDFMRMVLSNPDIDLDKLRKLGDRVDNGGGQEIVEKVRQVRAGEKFNL
jgi:hypothetical protein